MCCFRWCGRQLRLRNMPISGVNLTPRTTAVYASDPALPRRPQDSLPPCLLGFGRTRLALASSYRLLLSHPASGSRTRHHAFSRGTPSAVAERFSELLGCPISRSLTASSVGLELRPLPSPGVTRLQRCRVGGGALDCSRAGLRPPLKLDVQFSRTQLSRRRSSPSGNGRDHRD